MFGLRLRPPATTNGALYAQGFSPPLLRLPFALRQPLHLATHPRADRHTILEQDARADHRGHALAGEHGADEVERIAAADDDEFPTRLAPGDRSQRGDGFGQGELLADQAVDEAAAADFAAGFQSLVDLAQL